MPEQPDDPARKRQRRHDEPRTENEQPGFRCGAGQPGFCQIDEYRAEYRARQRAAAADRHPYRDFDRVAGRELAGIDDADLRDVEGTGNAGKDSRDGKDEQLCAGDRIAEKAHPAFGVAQRQQHPAEL